MALLIPSAVGEADSAAGAAFTERLSVALTVLLLATYGLGLLFSLRLTANSLPSRNTVKLANHRCLSA